MNQFDSSILNIAFNYFTQNPNDAELKHLLYAKYLTYPMKLELIKYLIENYPNKETLVLDCIELVTVYPEATGPLEITLYSLC
ncbi:MAG TPA: hypothetical protein PLD02_01340 [Saprospiraceae bacterium]|nr:hypothetical protein [Saprospiraceae bacterium]